MKTKLLLISLFISFMPFHTNAQGCNCSFSSHYNGSIIKEYPVEFSGKTERPSDTHVWILARLKGYEGWFPQGGEERTINNDQWTCPVYLGTETETGLYEVAIIVVSDEVNQSLNELVRKVRTNDYYPIPLPRMDSDCAVVMITVEKKL